MHVETQLSELLIYLVNKYGHIGLSGIGIFHIEDVPGSLIEEENILLPPQQKLVLSPIDTIHNELIGKAARHGLISQSDLDPLEKLIYQKAEELNALNTTRIQGIGTITIKDGHRILEPDDKGILSVRDYLPPVTVTLRNVVSLPDEVAHFQEEKEHLNTPHSSMKGKKIISTEGPNWVHYTTPLILFFIGIVSIISIFKYFANEEPETIKMEEEYIPIFQDTVGSEPTELLESSQIFDNEILNKYSDVLTQDIIDNGCKITVGSFKNYSNAFNMSERLVKDGYEVSMIEFDAGTRVIISFNCLEHDLIEYLKTIRRDLSPSAWYYQPDFEPDLE